MTKLFLALFVVIGLSACTKETVDNIGRDAALNIIVTGNWEKATRTISGNEDEGLNIATELLAEDETINFNKDGKAYVKKEGNDVRNYSFNMPSAKEMTFDGMTYAIQENIVQSITTLTLVNHTGPIRTEILFKRKR
ncbi:MAG TPA: hypothetical protein PKA53_04095 [Sphingobacterium sp.]|nr:hypothetical protein [Sphingobacterium sp.]